MILQTDIYNFAVVRTPAEINLARAAKHLNVKAVCPYCNSSKLVAINSAFNRITEGCAACADTNLPAAPAPPSDDDIIDSDCNEYRERNYDHED